MRRMIRSALLAVAVLFATLLAAEELPFTQMTPEGNPPLKELMEKGTHPYAMQTFEMHLKQLLSQGLLEKEIARAAAGF